MTISTTVSRIQHVPDGVATDFTFPYLVLEASHLQVYTTDQLGVDVLLVNGTDYTLTGVGEEDGVTVVCTTAPAYDLILTLARVVPTTQTTDYIANDRFAHETHERALDKLTMMVQQLYDLHERSIIYPITTSTDLDPELPSAADRAYKVLGFDEDGAQTMIALADVTAAVGDIVFTLGSAAGTATSKVVSATLADNASYVLVKAWIIDGANTVPTTERCLAHLEGTPSMDLQAIADPNTATFRVTNTAALVSVRLCVEISGVVLMTSAFNVGV